MSETDTELSTSNNIESQEHQVDVEDDSPDSKTDDESENKEQPS
jgi:hypothetical protein